MKEFYISIIELSLVGLAGGLTQTILEKKNKIGLAKKVNISTKIILFIMGVFLSIKLINSLGNFVL